MKRVILNTDSGEIQAISKDNRHTRTYCPEGEDALTRISSRSIKLLWFLLDNADSMNHCKLSQNQVGDLLGLTNLARNFSELKRNGIILAVDKRPGCYVNPLMFYRGGTKRKRMAVAKWKQVEMRTTWQGKGGMVPMTMDQVTEMEARVNSVIESNKEPLPFDELPEDANASQ